MLKEKIKESKIFEYDESETSFLHHDKLFSVIFAGEEFNNDIELVVYDNALPEGYVIATFRSKFEPSIETVIQVHSDWEKNGTDWNKRGQNDK